MKNLQYFILSIIINLLAFSGVTCNPLPNSTDTSKVFKVPCSTVEFFQDSNYTKSCFQKFDNPLCLALYDLGLKWCTKSSQNLNLPEITNVTQFDKWVLKFDSMDDVMKFCKTSKNITYKNETDSLTPFYKNEGICVQICLDPAKNNQEPKKLCSVLAMLEAAMKAANEKTAQPQSVNAETKPEELSKPVNPPNNSDKIADKVVKNEKKVNKTKPLLLKDESKPANKETPKVKDTPPNPEEQKEKSPQKNESPEQKGPPNLEADTKNEQNVKNNDEPVLDDNAESKNVQASNVQENPVVENTENKLDVNRKAKTDGIKSDKTEPVSIKTGKTVSNNEDIKSSTISEHTNDGDRFSEDELPPLGNEDPRADILEQEPDLIAEKKFSHYPGKKAEEESHIFSYFVAFSLLFVCCYIGYLNKKKILALLLEGRRSRNGRGRRRPSTANYRKLDCNLEEAVTSQCNSNATNVIY